MTVVELDPKVPFSIAATPKGATPFIGLRHFTLDRYLIMLSVKKGDIKYNFLSLWYEMGLNPGLLGHWQTLNPTGQLAVTKYNVSNLSMSSLGCKALYISGSFVEVLLLSTLRMVLSILWKGQHRCLSLWWNFCLGFE